MNITSNSKIVVIGLGYVGLPLAVALARSFDTVGLDIDEGRLAELRAGHDRTDEIDGETLKASTLRFTSDLSDCEHADAIIVTVPTPIDAHRNPDLGPVVSATRAAARIIDPARKPVLVYESTVYPGVTEDICGPLIEQVSDHRRGRDFVLGYSPERINPGDREHTVDRIVKVIAGEDAETTDRMAAIYDAVTSAGTFRAASIRVAEAAKVIENTQRDINIAFVNEITQIFAKLDMSVWDVLEAAGTKWNFLKFQPGLVGGHCIGVDPYYLAHRAEQLGIEPRIILAGRSVNDGMSAWIADEIHTRRASKAGRVLMLGLTFKEDVPDLRNSHVANLVRRLEWLGHQVTVHDPLADAAEANHEYGIALDGAALDRSYDVVVGAVPHADYRAFDAATLSGLVAGDGLIVDLKRIWPGVQTDRPTAAVWTL